MTHYHLHGMGVLGAFFAWELFAAKKAFTWNDIDAEHVAWKASTGLIYPSGEPEEMRAYHGWSKWHQRGAPWTAHLGRLSENGAFWFSSKHPPHGAKYDILTHIGPLYLGAYPSYHFNVQRFVEQSRLFFAERRTDDVPTGAQQIISHGFRIADHYVWGWSRKVKLLVSEEVLIASPARPTFYLRENRFQFAYANLVPNTPYHYAGSSTLSQKKLKGYSMEPKYALWKELFARLTGDLVLVAEEEQPLIEGWRPAMALKKQLYKQDDIYYAPAMGGSGVRMAPLLCSQLRSLI